jgi:predicted enzyme related to lactoylglutathione lyase
MGEGTWQTGRVVWRELLTPDVDSAQAFYGRLFDWRFDAMDLGAGPPYPTITAGGAAIGGFARMTPGARSPASWTSFVSVESVDAALSGARAGGGSVATGPFDVRVAGRVAVLADPWGASLGVFRAGAGDPPLPDVPPEGSFCWETLVTPDPRAALTFYGGTLGWTAGPGPGGGAVPVFLAGGRQVADVQKASSGRSAAWITYVRVARLEPVRDRARALGATVAVPELRVPSVGRVAMLADPQGAALALFEPAAGG